MTLLQSIVLGIVQGLTEFLPISSSGHLVIVPYLLGWKIPAEDAFIFDVLVQVATLLAVFAYFWKDLIVIARAFFRGIKRGQPFANPFSRLGWLLIAATIPAAVIGFLFKGAVERAFTSPLVTAFFLLVTAVLLLIAEFVGRRTRRLNHLTWQDAFWIGIFQALALFPGISRSGATITGGMTHNLERTSAARFSFLMAIPIMLAAGSLATLDLLRVPNLGNILPTFVPGFLTAGVVGYLAIRWLLRYLTRHPLYVFAAYCTLLAGVTLAAYYLFH